MTDAAVPRLSARVRPARPSAASAHRRRRVVTGVALPAVAALLLTACGNSSPGTAAVVGGQRITDSSLQSLVDESLAAPGVREALPASSYKGDMGAYRRSLLNTEVERLLAESAAQRLGIAVDQSKVDARYRSIEQQNGGSAAFGSTVATQLAVSLAVFRQRVRIEVIESEIGYEKGGVKRPSEAQIQVLYKQFLPTAISATLQVIQVPSLAIATKEAAAIKKAPETLKAIAQKYNDGTAQVAPDPQKYALSRLPEDLAAKLQKTAKNDVFPFTLSNGTQQGFFVFRFTGIDRPTLESVRPQLEAETLQQASQAGQKYLSTVAQDLGVDVNPRYGTWKPDNLSITDFVNPVIKPTPAAVTTPAGLPADGSNGDGTGSTGDGTGSTGGTGDGTQPTPTAAAPSS